MAKAAELDKDLVDGLKAVKSKRGYFALVLKGSNDGALILSKTKVPPGDIAAAKKQSGGSAVVKGFCQYEDGKYVFETAKEAPGTAAQAVKAIAKRDAGMAVNAEFRVSTDPELLADEGDSTATASTTAQRQQDGAAVMKRVNAMTADIMAALAGPNKDRVRALFAAINGQLQSKDFAGASKTLDELEPVLKQAKSAAPQPDGAELTKRLNGMTADIKAALAGSNKAAVQALYVAVSGQIKGKDFVQASKSLDELDLLLKQAAPTVPPQQDGAELTKRLNGMTADIKAALAGPNKARVQSLYVAVSGQIKSNDFAQVGKTLDELEALVKPTKGGSPSQQSGPDLTAALQAWTAARAAASEQLTKLVDAFKTSGHPQAERGMELLRAVINKQLTPRPVTAHQVDELLRYVETDEIFTDAETPNPFGFKVTIRTPLLKALGELKKHVA